MLEPTRDRMGVVDESGAGRARAAECHPGVLDGPLAAAPRLRPLSRRELNRLVELGWFAGERLELLRGMLVTVTPQRWQHADVVAYFTERLVLQLAGRLRVRPQLGFAADAWSQPLPDLAVVPPIRRCDHPCDAELVVEVADGTLAIDRGIKRDIYAWAGVPEYWIVDLATLIVEVYTRPTLDGYSEVCWLRDGDVLRPAHLPEVAIPIAEIPR